MEVGFPSIRLLPTQPAFYALPSSSPVRMRTLCRQYATHHLHLEDRLHDRVVAQHFLQHSWKAVLTLLHPLPRLLLEFSPCRGLFSLLQLHPCLLSRHPGLLCLAISHVHSPVLFYSRLLRCTLQLFPNISIQRFAFPCNHIGRRMRKFPLLAHLQRICRHVARRYLVHPIIAEIVPRPPLPRLPSLRVSSLPHHLQASAPLGEATPPCTKLTCDIWICQLLPVLWIQRPLNLLPPVTSLAALGTAVHHPLIVQSVLHPPPPSHFHQRHHSCE